MLRLGNKLVFGEQFTIIKQGEILGLSTFQLLAFLRRAIFYTFVSVYLKELLKLSTFEVTLLATAGMITNTTAQTLFWGRLLDKYHRPVLFITLGEFIAGLGHFLVFGVQLYFLNQNRLTEAGFAIIFGLALIEIPWSLSNVGWSTIISDLTLPKERTSLMAMLSIVGGFGGILGALFGGFLYQDGMGFENGILFYVPAVIMILTALFVKLTLNDERARALRDETSIEENLVSDKSFSEFPLKWLFVAFIVSLIFINFGRNSVILITQLFLASNSGFNAGGPELGLYRNIGSIAVLVVSLLLYRYKFVGKEIHLFMIGSLLSIVGLVVLSFVPNFTLSLIAAALIGSSQILIQVVSYSLISYSIPPKMRGRLFAIYNASFMLSFGLAGSAITGPLADYLIGQGYLDVNAYRVTFYVAIGLVLIGILIFLPLIRKFQQLSVEAS